VTAGVDHRDGGSQGASQGTSKGGSDGGEITMTITIRDWGNGVDPSCVPQRPYDPLEPGGVGLICLRQWLDEVRYDRQPDGGMLTTMRKKKS